MAPAWMRGWAQPPRAFTIIELLVTLAIVAILVALLAPALGVVRETAHRLTCANNQHSIGGALALFAKDNRDRIPRSYFGRPEVGMPQEMMAGSIGPMAPIPNTWEGLGWLSTAAGGYVDSNACFYCASHTGNHPHERYLASFSLTAERIYLNYHYKGDRDGTTGRLRLIDQPVTHIFLTDGLRTQSDFNHGSGVNRLHGDLSVSWRPGLGEKALDLIPAGVIPPTDQVEVYETIWESLIED